MLVAFGCRHQYYLPVTLVLVQKQNESSVAERDEMTVDLESYLVRRMCCGLTTQNYNRVFLSLLRNLRLSGQVNRAELQRLLLELEGDSVRWPTDYDFGRLG